MYRIDYYTELSGREPVREWLRGLDKKPKAVITGKIARLEKYGLLLLQTSVMKRIANGDKDFYELRGGNCRIALYQETVTNSFVLLHGFLKKRQREVREISLARDRLREYQSRR